MAKEFAKQPQYEKMLPEWQKLRDLYEGSSAVKAPDRRQIYLPRNESFDVDDYAFYVERSLFFEAVEKTVKALAGAISFKPASIEYPKPDELKEIGFQGQSVQSLLEQADQEVTLLGRIGYLVDCAESDHGGSAKPYIAQYVAESIIDWHQVNINNVLQLDRVVLQETLLEDDLKAQEDTMFAQKKVTQWRVLKLDFVTNELTGEETPVYTQEVWRLGKGTDGTDELQLVEEPVTPKVNGRSFDFIPFVFINAEHNEPSVVKPPMQSLGVTNISHFRTTADLEWGCFFTSLPQFVVVNGNLSQGEDDTGKDTRVKIGSSYVMHLNGMGGDKPEAYYAEFSGKGLGSLENRLESKQQMMAAQGAKLLDVPKAGVEAADALEIRTASERSALSVIEQKVSAGFTELLEIVHFWTTGQEATDILVKQNDNFNNTKLTAPEQKEMLAQVQAGTMSHETFFWNLHRAGLVPEDRTFEEEQGKIAESMLNSLQSANDNDNPNVGTVGTTET